jgi:hypothetical protein
MRRLPDLTWFAFFLAGVAILGLAALGLDIDGCDTAKSKAEREEVRRLTERVEVLDRRIGDEQATRLADDARLEASATDRAAATAGAVERCEGRCLAVEAGLVDQAARLERAAAATDRAAATAGAVERCEGRCLSLEAGLVDQAARLERAAAAEERIAALEEWRRRPVRAPEAPPAPGTPAPAPLEWRRIGDLEYLGSYEAGVFMYRAIRWPSPPASSCTR